jgi:hypothetical protein
MSAFTRTNSGIANYHKFYGSSFTAFIEGKENKDNLSEASDRCRDIEFYEAVLTSASGGRHPKIKCVGSKTVVLEYAKKIRANNISKSVAIVDKDLEGINSSILTIGCEIRTFGYSWENELWSLDTIKTVTAQLTNSNSRAERDVVKATRILAYRLKYLSLLDAAMQADGKSLLKKTSALCGVSFDFPTLSFDEIARLSNVFKKSSAFDCPICRSIASAARDKEPAEIIQGHFWSNVAIKLITYVYKKYTRDSMPSNSLVERLALSHIKANPTLAIGQHLMNRYAKELLRVGI